MFNIILGSTSDESNKLDKTIVAPTTFSGVLRDGSSILSPVVLIESGPLSGYNYAEIPTFGRKYFITDITSVRNGLTMVSMRVDVLSTYASQIRANTAVIARNTNVYNLFLNDPEIKTYQNPYIFIRRFSGSLPEKGMVTLIVSGGVSSND